ncbi:DoxX-like family protein [Leptospira fainei serovar Hurstbridge str. BUT 6]|uniref:DoxX-like family protein n=1 Tax=Leptospira fainei serovar Hurstbridge str. BUT 6 TaxID=1193011 RepID=S3W5F4_9LEPT|nr:DoxX family protein [Leptospira fainei]EPG75457.1 DoxX-like family protein [Leptospira fainei serovar Hurstbridge str. BUT 6]
MANSIHSIQGKGKTVISESEKKEKWIKTAKWIYWTLTLSFTITMLMAAVMLLAGVPYNVEGITRLGYPIYVCKILGIAKLLGGIFILQNKFRTLKEWAYAGYSFNLIGAAASHAFSGDGFGAIVTPIVILSMVLLSYRQWKTGWM